MAISLASLRATTSLAPPRILMHGVAGVGKSTYAADADRPVFIMRGKADGSNDDQGCS